MKLIKLTKHGFTLIEMLIVVGILGILVSLATPAIYKSMYESKKPPWPQTLRLYRMLNKGTRY